MLQVLVALFAEDIGLIEQYFVTRLLDDCQEPRDSFDLLGGLFEAMNTARRNAPAGDSRASPISTEGYLPNRPGSNSTPTSLPS